MGTTQSTTILPASGSASSRRMSACPAYGTATITRSAAPATSAFAPPMTETSTPAAAAVARSATSAALPAPFGGSPRAEQDPLSRGRQPHRQPAPLRPGAADHPDDQLL